MIKRLFFASLGVCLLGIAVVVWEVLRRPVVLIDRAERDHLAREIDREQQEHLDRLDRNIRSILSEAMAAEADEHASYGESWRRN